MKKVIHLTVFALIAFTLSTASTHAQNIAATPFAVYLPLVQGDGAGGAATPTPTPTPTPGGDIYENPRDVLAIRREVIRLVNEYRVANGCPAATESPILMSAAQEWSVYMHTNDYFQHSNTVNKDWYSDHGYPKNSTRENVALGYYTATNVMEGWKTSPGHNKTLLACPEIQFNSSYVYDVGVGLEGLYWTFALGVRLN